METLCDFTNINEWLTNKQEIEIIDQYLHLKNKLNNLNINNDDMRNKLNNLLNIILNSLPIDVQLILNNNQQQQPQIQEQLSDLIINAD